MVLPKPLLPAARAVKSLTNYGHPKLEQMALADFLKTGAFLRHLRRIRRSYASVRDCLVGGLTARFGPVDIWGAGNGMHIMWRLPKNFPKPEALAAQVARHGVQIYTLAGAGAIDFASEYPANSLLLGYSSLTEEEIAKGVAAIASAVEELNTIPNRSATRSGDGTRSVASRRRSAKAPAVIQRR
jgi:GntR family transcriptional regulator/MocR family aminotransferase